MAWFKKLGIQPSQIHTDSATHKVYGKDYEIPKKFVKLPRISKKRIMTDEQKQAGAERLAKARGNKVR